MTLSPLVYVEVPGDIARTSKGGVRKSTRSRLIRLAREQRPDLADAAVTELFYPMSEDEVKFTRVTFNTDKPAILGFR